MLWRNNFTDSDLLRTTTNCSFVKNYLNNNLYITKLEYSFPIAFVFVIYNSPQQVVRLLRVLYRHHNQYCLHPDLKSDPDFINIFRNIASCLENVHIASELRDVRWGNRSIMESMMCCNQDLMTIREKQAEEDRWKYVINLCGKELPLNSNHEIVSHLVNLKGTSMIEARTIKPGEKLFLRLWNKGPVPYSIPYAIASSYMSLSSTFVNFLLKNLTAIRLYEFFKKRHNTRGALFCYNIYATKCSWWF